MNTEAIRHLREKLSNDKPVYGLWVTLESASITEIAVAMGLDWVVIDAEHGHLDWRDILEHVRASVRSNTVVLVRVAETNQGLIKRALDIGADGVIVPWIESADQLRRAVSYATYPPEGLRGIGAERATCWGQCVGDHVAEAGQNVLVVPMIESVAGAENIDSILSVPGVETFFFGPADFSSSAGYPGQMDAPGVAEKISACKDKIRRAGKHCGVIAGDDRNVAERCGQGFRMLGLGIDSNLLIRSLRSSLSSLGREPTIRTGFVVENDPEAVAAEIPVSCTEEKFRPDREAVMNDPSSGPQLEIANGVSFDCMVGAHNEAHGLTTGLVTFQPGATLPYHRHTFAESITLLEGNAVCEVEGRRYTLEPLDNVTIPRGLAHSTMSTDPDRPAIFQIAMAAAQPTRELVDQFFSKRAMPDSSTGVPGAEHVTRIKTAPRYEPGSDASFVDYCNSDMIQGIEMCGGYGKFEKGGRLPAHLHDFDESIFIAEGMATCIVEGKRYSLSDRATALQPRGRIHYFKNEVDAPMSMIWFYAGPMPERIVVDDRCGDVPGAAWG